MARVQGKPKMVSERYLSSAADIEAALDRSEARTMPDRTRHPRFGDVVAVAAMLTELDVAAIIDKVVGPRRSDAGASVGTYLALDMTNFATYIDTANGEAPIAQRGTAKQKRTDLCLIGLGMVVTRTGGIPLVWDAYPGNRFDVTNSLPRSTTPPATTPQPPMTTPPTVSTREPPAETVGVQASWTTCAHSSRTARSVRCRCVNGFPRKAMAPEN